MQTKTYTYTEPYYTIEVKVEGGFCAFLVLFLGWHAYVNSFGVWPVFAIGSIVAAYQVWNTFIAGCYPHSITIGDDKVSVEVFGKTTNYTIDAPADYSIRGTSGGKMYVRMGDHNALRGRYWIPTNVFEDGEELASRLLEIEERIAPDSLRVQARTSASGLPKRSSKKRQRRG